MASADGDVCSDLRRRLSDAEATAAQLAMALGENKLRSLEVCSGSPLVAVAVAVLNYIVRACSWVRRSWKRRGADAQRSRARMEFCETASLESMGRL